MFEIALLGRASAEKHTKTSVAVNGTPNNNQNLYLPGTRGIHTVATCSFRNVHSCTYSLYELVPSYQRNCTPGRVCKTTRLTILSDKLPHQHGVSLTDK